MVRIVKYTTDLEGAEAGCGEHGCEEAASVHVCFEDGTGVSVCQKCLEARVNEGEWITDSCQVLLAS